MTKTLTEQWKEGKLDEGWYYVVIEWDDEIRMLYFEGDYFLDTDVPLDNDNIKEVLAHVPCYEEYKRLQEQLNEANEVIKKYRVVEMGLRNNKGTLESVCPAFDYLKKWGVK